MLNFAGILELLIIYLENIMLLCIDIGNTNITLGLFEGKSLGPRWRLETIHDRMPDEFGIQLIGLLQHAKINPSDVDFALIASVVPPLTEKWVQVCEQYVGCKSRVVNSNTITGIKILIDDAE